MVIRPQHRAIRPLSALLVLTAALALGRAQERSAALDGSASIGATNSRGRSEYANGPRSDSHATDMPWGFDLFLRTYLLDPRFLSIAVDTNFLKGGGVQEQYETGYSNLGWSVTLEFLKNSYYPLRFYYLKSNHDYIQRRLSGTNMLQRNIGLDWTLRKPRKPPLFFTFQNAQYDYGFAPQNSTVPTYGFVSNSRMFGLGTRGAWRGWDSSVQYNRIDTRESHSGTLSGLDMLRADTRRALTAKSTLLVNLLIQNNRTSNEAWRLSQEMPLLYARAELETRVSRKFTTRVYDQSYLTAIRQRSPSAILPAVTADVPPAAPPALDRSSTVNDAGGRADYRLTDSLTVGAIADVSMLSPWEIVNESPSRIVNASGLVAWQKRMKIVDLHASLQPGTAYVVSSLGNSRRVPTASYTAGLRLGDRASLLLGLDGYYAERPDLYEIGSTFRHRMASAVLESLRLRAFGIQATAAWNDFDYLNSRGRERTRTNTFGLSLTNRFVSLQASRNATAGLRTGFLPLIPPGTGLFRPVPVGLISQLPMLPVNTVYTIAGLTVRPVRNLDLQLRYFQQRIRARHVNQDLFSEQYEAFLSYTLGKFFLSGGVLQYYDQNAGPVYHHRTYYFWRLTRKFHVL